MKATLQQLATVQMGYSFRAGLEASANGKVAVIQMKDLLDNTVCCDTLTRISMEAVKSHHLAQKGDLIFRSRGLWFTSAILLEDPGCAVVAAPLLRIRVTQPDVILPEYLNWYLGQRDAQVFLASRTEGTISKMISKQAIDDLEVAVPSLERQHHIVALAALSAREQTLRYALAEKREQYISTQLLKLAKGTTESSRVFKRTTEDTEGH